MLKNQKGFAPVITLLFIAFVLTSYVAIKSQNQMVLGEDDVNVEEERKEIKEVKVREVKSKLERSVANEAKRQEAKIRNEDGKVKLKIQNREKEFEYEDGSLKLKIKDSSPSGEDKDLTIKPSDDDEMEIEDDGRRVRTNFPITVNQEDGTISVTTPNGEVKVKELPSTAIDNMIENGFFNKVTDATIEESKDGQTPAVLNVKGENEYKFLGLFKVKGEVTAEVNQETGEVSKTKTPWFMNTFGFLFSK